MPPGDAYSSIHLVQSYFGLAYVLLVETNPFPELVVILSGLFSSIIPRYFLNLAWEFAIQLTLHMTSQLCIFEFERNKICEDFSRRNNDD